MADMTSEAGEFAFQVFIGSIILFGVYVGMFFLLSQTGFIDLDINLFLEEFGLAFVATTVVWKFLETGFGWIRS